MASEILQFAGFLGAVVVVFVLWLNIIYLPGRTLEQRYDGAGGARRSGTGGGVSNKGADGEEFSQNSSDRTI